MKCLSWLDWHSLIKNTKLVFDHVIIIILLFIGIWATLTHIIQSNRRCYDCKDLGSSSLSLYHLYSWGYYPLMLGCWDGPRPLLINVNDFSYARFSAPGNTAPISYLQYHCHYLSLIKHTQLVWIPLVPLSKPISTFILMFSLLDYILINIDFSVRQAMNKSNHI